MYLGIDLGTSNSAITGLVSGQVKVFKTQEGTDTMPSVLYRDRRGNQTVGVRAFDQAALSPDNAVDGFKRLMGTDTPLRFGSTGQDISAVEASTEIIRALVGQATVEAGTSVIDGVVVTIPAAFNQLQSEATLQAARAAGLGRVALLQEPVAAALAAMATSRDRNGLFLVYDLGGGTFDAALVHAIEGEVTVLAHEGDNALGGRDLDRLLVDNVAVPWLRRTFDLPADFAVSPTYRRLIRMTRRAADAAKVALSTRERTTISASDDEIRLEDLKGEPIYLDVPLARPELETHLERLIDRSVACCRDMLAHVGYRHEDVARIVMVGGPTKIPFLRRQVGERLGIHVEDAARLDPMTAVSVGAAIYCEGRDWSSEASTAKPSRVSEAATGPVSVSYDYESRTAAETARLTVAMADGPQGAEVLVESALGWSSGRRKLSGPVVFELQLRDVGLNEFRATVFDADGKRLPEASRVLGVTRLLSSTGGIPAAHTVAAKILDGAGRNVLDVLVHKGTLLPASGVVNYRLAVPLRAGSGASVLIELFQISNPLVTDPHLNLPIGMFKLRADDLPEAEVLRMGDEVRIHWAMSEGQSITAEVELPTVGARLDGTNFYDWQVSRQNFAGEEGGKLAGASAERAARDLDVAEEAVDPADAAPLRAIRKRLDDHSATLHGTLDPDTRRGVVEQVRLLRQDISMLCRKPEARAHLLRRDVNVQRRFYDRDVRSDATADEVGQVDELFRNADASIAHAAFDTATEIVNRIISLYWVQGFRQDRFCVRQFELHRNDKHMALDQSEFGRRIIEGEEAIATGDMATVRAAAIAIILNRHFEPTNVPAPDRAALMRS